MHFMKRCTGCSEIKPSTAYRKDSRGEGGRSSKCRQCLSDYEKDLRSRRTAGLPSEAEELAEKLRTAEEKKCSRCGEVKPLSEYYKRSGYASLYTHCKQCHGSLSAAGEKQRGPRPNQAERNRARVEKYWSNRAEHLLKARAARYGISVEVARELSESPCHICGAEESGVKDNPMYIDHCHQSGRVRGALCNNCNRYVGLREKYAHLEERYQEYVSDPTPY